ncbi:MAG: single-stranded DNA-binding protein [Halobacteriovorax sp.]|nr:single-stranded DNA-binding protein [Halobacteriovorax sp.]|tara:strand:- start:683 stop:1033 length:351 start_codon:yes stop_codon:yes gene_type:complete
MSINKVILIGRLGADPELRYTSEGNPVCNLSVATSERWIDDSGNKQERVEWHRAVAWNNLAENCNKYLTKGREVYIEGKIQTRNYEDKEGVTKYTTEIVAQKVEFIGGQGKVNEAA